MKKLFLQVSLLFSFFLFVGLFFAAAQSYACSTGNDCPYYEYCDGGVWPFNNGTCRHFNLTGNPGEQGTCDNQSTSTSLWQFSAPALGNWNGYNSWPWISYGQGGASGNQGQACPEGIIFGKHTLGNSYCLHTGNCTSSEYSSNSSGYSGSPICEVFDTGSSCGYYADGGYNINCGTGAQSCTNYQACTGGPYFGPCPGNLNSCECICPAHTECVDATRTSSGFWTYSGYNAPCTTSWCQPYCNTGGPVNCGSYTINQSSNTCGTVSTPRTCQHNTNPNGACVITSASNYTYYSNTTYNYCTTNYTCPNINGSGPLDCITHIYAHIYIDYAHNGSNDANYPYGIVCINGGNCQTTGSDGSVTYSGLTTGTYTISYSDNSPDYQNTGATSQTVNLTNSTGNVTVNFRVTPLYKISGNVFNDKNKNMNYDGSDSLYTNTSTIHFANGPTAVSDITTSSGTYSTAETLWSGTYTVSQTHTLAAGYSYTTPSSWSITLGNPVGAPDCNVNNSPDASCVNPNAGSISNLNFGLTNENPWQQSVCYDVRDDSGTYTNSIPAAPSCGGVSGAYNSITNADCSTGAGIIFTCDATPDFGLGSANANGWQAGGAGAQQECFSGAGINVIRTSYDYLLTTARESGITPIDMATVCSISNCTLPANLAKGVYIAHGDLHLSTYTFPVDPTTPQGFIFLIDGNLYIDGNILVPAGSVAAFSASGNMYVDKSVGNVVSNPDDPAVNNPNLEGLYSADGSFIIQSYGTTGGNDFCNADGTPKDKKLNVIGSIITNAAQKGGSFVNNRDLCIYDLACSSVSAGDGNPDGSGSDNEGLGVSYILTLYADGKFLNHKLFNWEELKP